LRVQNVEQSTSLRKMKNAVERITSYSKAQQKRVACLEDEIALLRQISAETQQRQLNELQSAFTSTTQQQQQQQHREGKALGCLSLTVQYNAWHWTDIKSLESVCLSVCLCVCPKCLLSWIATAVLSDLPHIYNVGHTSDNGE